MLIRVDILDDRLEAIEADDDREQLRRYLELWREDAVDPLRDPGTVLIVELEDGPRPRRLVVNDGLANGTAEGASPSRPPALVADQRGQGPRLATQSSTSSGVGERRASRSSRLARQAGVQLSRVPGGERRHVVHAQLLEHQAEHHPDPVDPRQVGAPDQREQGLGLDPGLARETVPVPASRRPAAAGRRWRSRAA